MPPQDARGVGQDQELRRDGVQVVGEGLVGGPGQLGAAGAVGEMIERGDDAGRAEGDDEGGDEPGDRDGRAAEHATSLPASGGGRRLLLLPRMAQVEELALHSARNEAERAVDAVEGADVVERELAELVGRDREEAQVERLHGAGRRGG